MKVASQLEEAQFEQIATADESSAGKESGRVYFNTDTFEILIGDGSEFKRYATTQAAVGDVKHSMLTESQFQAEVDDTWVIADGRPVPGSDFETITGNPNIPDMRGTFLRGKNNGRLDGLGNATGDLPLGDYQQDGVGTHVHNIITGAATQPVWTGRFTMNTTTFPGDPSGGSYNISSTSNPNGEQVNETKPRNITVNIFIKINRV